jgi:hypothetical protein
MSRITRGRIEPGDPLDATDLNNRFSDYTQGGTLNQENTRDGAFDTPHLTDGIITKGVAKTFLGTGDWTRSSVNTVTSQTVASTAAVKFPVEDAGGTETRLDAADLTWTIGANDVLRIYWDLSVHPQYVGSPWTASPSLLAIPKDGGGTVNLSVGGHCWIISLEWDITSAALSNFVPIFGGTDFTATLSTWKGGTLPGCRHATVVPAWRLSTINSVDGQAKNGSSGNTADKTGWYGSSGSFYYAPTTPGVTVYGIRVVIHGIYHPAQSTTENYLLVDDTVGGAGQKLDYSGGFLTALWQRTQ